LTHSVHTTWRNSSYYAGKKLIDFSESNYKLISSQCPHDVTCKNHF